MSVTVGSIIVSVLLVLPFSILAQSNDSSWSILPSIVSRVYNECERKDYELSDCLKVKLISFFDRISRSDQLKLDDSVSLVRDANRVDHSRALSENEIEGSVASDDDKSGKLNQLIIDRVSKFLASHSLKVNLPTFDAASISTDLSEGRGKMKKTMGMFMMAAMMKMMMMIPLSIGTLFILAGKALIISKIALVLSLIILLKKLLSKPTEHVVHESHGWNPSAASGGWDKRSYRQPDLPYTPNAQAQNLAYNSYINH